MIKELENNAFKAVYYYQPDNLNTNEAYKINFTMKFKREIFGTVVVSPLYLSGKLGICFQLLDSPNVYDIQSKMVWPVLGGLSPKGISMLLLKTNPDLPCQLQEMRFDYDYSGNMNLICAADCLETACIITIYKGTLYGGAR